MARPAGHRKSIWDGAVLRSNDARLIKTFFEQVRAGAIWINDPLTDNYAVLAVV